MKLYNKNFLGEKWETKQIGKKYLKPLDYVKKITKKELVCQCPLCGKNEYVVIGKFPIDMIIEYWVNNYRFNPIADVYRGEVLEKRYCENCGLYYYNYHLPDSEQMYNELSNRSNYYPLFREEYGVATEIIENLRPKSLLEIGAGNGGFLERIQHIVPKAVGSEYNPHAVKICQNKGLNMITKNIADIKEKFDVVCNFEVLEHVFDTHKFLQQSVKLLKKGGKLIIGTPDPEGIGAITSKYQLNLPPHHQYDFSKKAFDWIAENFGLKVYDYQKLELTYRHYAKYIKILTGKELDKPDLPGFYETQKRYTGHTHVVVFEKI